MSKPFGAPQMLKGNMGQWTIRDELLQLLLLLLMKVLPPFAGRIFRNGRGNAMF
jgi:hypothetical protein